MSEMSDSLHYSLWLSTLSPYGDLRNNQSHAGGGSRRNGFVSSDHLNKRSSANSSHVDAALTCLACERVGMVAMCCCEFACDRTWKAYHSA